MKFLIITCILITPVFSQSGVVKQAPSAEGVAALRENWKNNRGSNLRRASEEVKVRQSNRDFMATSVYFVGARGFTLLPKGSILTAGRNFKVVQEEPEHLPYMDWPVFMRAHRAGLVVHAVTAEQLQHGKSLKSVSETKTRCENAGLTCVTTYKLNPVRVAKEPKDKSLTKTK